MTRINWMYANFLLTTSGVRGFEPRFSPLKELDHVLEPQGF